MRHTTVGILSALGMLFTSVTVWSVTPDGGYQAKAEPLASEASASSGGAEEPSAEVDPAHFVTGNTLRLDARLGHAKMIEGESGETFVLVEIAGTEDATTGAGAPANAHLAIVMDQSGSMRGSRLANAKSAALRAIDTMRDGDMVTVVTFDTRSRTVVPPTVIDPSSRSRIASDVQRIELGGDTCVSCGVETALGELTSSKDRVARMLVLSDGDTNSGIRDVAGFKNLAKRAADRGVSITTIGVDVDYNESIMAAIADGSNGRHYFVDNDAGLAKIFEDEAQFLSRTVASEAVAEIELAPGVELEKVFDRTFSRSGSRLRVPLGAFAAGEKKTILLKVRTPGGGKGGDVNEIAQTSVRFRDQKSGTEATTQGKLGVTMVTTRDAASPLDGVVAGRLERAETTAVLREANQLFRLGKIDDARKKLATQRQSVADNLEGAKNRAPAARAKDVEQDFKKQERSLDEAEQAFAAPPSPAPATPGNAPAQPPAPSRANKGGAKRALEHANDMAF
jgi:Ca-activated chloride channel family protein